MGTGKGAPGPPGGTFLCVSERPRVGGEGQRAYPETGSFGLFFYYLIRQLHVHDGSVMLYLCCLYCN